MPDSNALVSPVGFQIIPVPGCSIHGQVLVDRLSASEYRSSILSRVMTHSGVSHSTILVAGFVALAYGSLMGMAANCALRHIGPSNSHTHHGSQESGPYNAALCALACQAIPDAGLVPESLALSTSQVVRLVVTSPDQEFPSLSSSLLRSRAPPSMPFISIE